MFWISFIKMDKLTHIDELRHALHAEQLLLLAGVHQAEQCTGLGAIIRVFMRLGEVEAVEVHDLVPGCGKVTHELFLRIVLCIDLGQGA